MARKKWPTLCQKCQDTIEKECLSCHNPFSGVYFCNGAGNHFCSDDCATDYEGYEELLLSTKRGEQ